MSVGQFIGPVKIEEINEMEYKTPAGQVVYKVLCDDGRVRIITEKQIETSVTDEVSDWTSLRERRMFPLAEKVLAMMLEYNMAVGDMEHLFLTVGRSVDESFNQAASILWHGDDTNYTPGSETNGDERVFVQADKVLKNGTPDKTDGPTAA